MISIREIQMKSNALPVVGSYGIQGTGDNCISTFSPLTTSAKDRYEYITTSEWRFFDMHNDGPIQLFDLQVFVDYTTGENEIVLVPPNEEFFLKLHFKLKQF
jgi:hypothetical protein